MCSLILYRWLMAMPILTYCLMSTGRDYIPIMRRLVGICLQMGRSTNSINR